MFCCCCLISLSFRGRRNAPVNSQYPLDEFAFDTQFPCDRSIKIPPSVFLLPFEYYRRVWPKHLWWNHPTRTHPLSSLEGQLILMSAPWIVTLEHVLSDERTDKAIHSRRCYHFLRIAFVRAFYADGVPSFEWPPPNEFLQYREPQILAKLLFVVGPRQSASRTVLDIVLLFNECMTLFSIQYHSSGILLPYWNLKWTYQIFVYKYSVSLSLAVHKAKWKLLSELPGTGKTLEGSRGNRFPDVAMKVSRSRDKRLTCAVQQKELSNVLSYDCIRSSHVLHKLTAHKWN